MLLASKNQNRPLVPSASETGVAAPAPPSASQLAVTSNRPPSRQSVPGVHGPAAASTAGPGSDVSKAKAFVRACDCDAKAPVSALPHSLPGSLWYVLRAPVAVSVTVIQYSTLESAP